MTWFSKKCLSINGYFPQSQRQIRILILDITQCIPVVKILIFLDLAKTISFLDGHQKDAMRKAYENIGNWRRWLHW
jgi:hypothetical protein